MSAPTFSVDWTTVVVSLSAALVVAIVTYLLTERSNVRAFRRQRLYEAKLDTYLGILQSVDRIIDALEIYAGSSIRETRDAIERGLKGAGYAGKALEDATRSMDQAVIPFFVNASWDGISDQPLEMPKSPVGGDAPASGPAASSSPTVDTKVLNFVRLMSVYSTELRRLNAAMTRLSLLRVPESLARSLKALFSRFQKLGTDEMVFKVFEGEGGTAGREIDKLRDLWTKLADECGDDLETTMN